MTNGLDCKNVGKCGGCPLGQREFAPQEKAKLVQGIFPSASMAYFPLNRVRDRADLIWERVNGHMHLGLYGLEGRETVDLADCPMMSEALENWLHDFRKKAPPIKKGSVRLRVSPRGERGVWLDFANEDVKNLFAEKEYLQWLSGQAFVEIGQRRKALRFENGLPKLGPPEMKAWFETYGANFEPIPLYGPVGGFSQAGFAANRALVGAVCDLAKESGVTQWLELFCGNGNFALALAARGHKVEGIELDELALVGLAKSLEQSGPLMVETHRGDVYLKTKSLPQIGERGLLVDPPRAGLRELLAQIEYGEAPRALLYVSCFTESFLNDAEKLKRLGYKVKNLIGIDQFPFTPHAEWVALFMRD